MQLIIKYIYNTVLTNFQHNRDVTFSNQLLRTCEVFLPYEQWFKTHFTKTKF